MPLILESYDSLPYIDSDVSQAERDQIKALIAKELKTVDQEAPHASLPPMAEPKFSEMIAQEIQQAGSGKARKGGVDVTRYDIPDEPASNEDVEAWRATLRSAYSSSTYMSGRQVNLELLEESGKNAWLISNSQLEEILKSQDRELERLKQEIDAVNKERKLVQEGSKGELAALEAAWERGIGRLVEVQVATDNLRQELLNRTRTG